MFEQLRDKLSETLGNISTTKIVMIVVLLSVFVGATYYVYQYYVQPRLNPDFVPNKEFISEDSANSDTPSGPAKIVYYYVKWCPHCKKATPEWQKVKKEFNGKDINGTEIVFEEVDCEKNAESTQKANDDKVTAYPTIKLHKADNTIVEYNAKPEAETLKEFLNMTL